MVEVCLVTGVGGATGASICRRFVRAGYRVAMLARNGDRLKKLEAELTGGKGYVCDVGDLDALNRTIERVRADLGSPSAVIHNAVSSTFGTFMAADPEELERNFRVNVTALLHLARATAPDMIAAKRGAIITTGNTASLRGVPNYALFAPTKAAQRILAEALARELGPKHIHVGYVVIDGQIDSPWISEGKTKPPVTHGPPSNWPHRRDEWFVDPDAIGDEVFHLTNQHPSTWTFDLTIRPFAEKW